MATSSLRAVLVVALVAGGCSSGGGELADGGGMSGGGGTAGAGGGGGSGGGSMISGVVASGVRWFGRVDVGATAGPRFAWSGTGFIARFMGTSLTAQISNGGAFLFKAVVDGTPQPAFSMAAGQSSRDLATGLSFGQHTVELYRQTEGGQGSSQLLALSVGGGALMDPPSGPARLIEVIGDSISAGYGTLGTTSDTDCFPTESHWDTYASVAARALGAEVSTIAASGRGVYRNYGGDMTDTMPAIYARILTNDATPLWDFRTQPQAVVINLGTNDISNNKGDPGTPFRDLYRDLVQTVRTKYPGAYIACMVAPLLNATEQATIHAHIKAVVDARVASGDTRVELFDKVGQQASDKFACQYHPNPAENQLMGDALAAELRVKLGW